LWSYKGALRGKNSPNDATAKPNGPRNGNVQKMMRRIMPVEQFGKRSTDAGVFIVFILQSLLH
jgi:hypothetical protein